MKKAKKLTALVLAMMMSLSIMAVTASAYSAEEHEHACAVCSEDDGIMPLVLAGPCPKCGGGAYYYPRQDGNTIVVCLDAQNCGYSGPLY